MFYISTEEEIKKGVVSDIYFRRTEKILKAKGIDKHTLAEIYVKKFPNSAGWGVLSGIEEVSHLLSGRDVTVTSLPEGTIFETCLPVMTIEGKYLNYCRLETSILGLLCQSSGIATKTARLRRLAKDKTILSFGARRMHPAIAPMIDRSSFIGGCDGISVEKSAEMIKEKPQGTIPHSLVLIMGDTVKALKAFDEIVEPQVNRIALIDTFQDEKFESVRVSRALKDKLFAIRLDTPASRRGDLFEILKEIRWELDIRGGKSVKLLVSGGIDEKDILRLNPLADGYGIGTAISNAPVIDFSMDIVEIEGAPIAKRGKMSGRKEVYRCGICLKSIVLPFGRKPSGPCRCGNPLSPAHIKLIDKGKKVGRTPSPRDIRSRLLTQLSSTYFDFEDGHF